MSGLALYEPGTGLAVKNNHQSSMPVPTLEKIAVRCIRRHIIRLGDMVRYHLKVSSLPVPSELVEEILLACREDVVVPSLRLLGRVNPMVDDDPAFDVKYWKPAVENDFSSRAIPGPYEYSLAELTGLLAALNSPEDRPSDRINVKRIAGFPFSVKLLKATDAGLILKQIGKVKSDELVSCQAKALCSKWRSLYSTLQIRNQTVQLDEGAQQEGDAEKSNMLSLLLGDIAIGEDFENISTWKELYVYCERKEKERGDRLGAKLRKSAEAEEASRHLAVMLPKAPPAAGSTNKLHKAPLKSTVLKSTGLTVGGSHSSSNLYQKGKSIRQVLSAHTAAHRLAKPASKAGGAKKRPLTALTSDAVLLSLSTKRTRTIVTDTGAVMRLPRRNDGGSGTAHNISRIATSR